MWDKRVEYWDSSGGKDMAKQHCENVCEWMDEESLPRSPLDYRDYREIIVDYMTYTIISL
eukprot:SAG22_NODE_754_length_7443_cov_4.952478_6_plen_60_part_00